MCTPEFEPSKALTLNLPGINFFLSFGEQLITVNY